MTDPDAPAPDGPALNAEDAKLVTLARSGRPRALAGELPQEGAAGKAGIRPSVSVGRRAGVQIGSGLAVVKNLDHRRRRG